SDHQVSMNRTSEIVLRTLIRRPTSRCPNSVHLCGIQWVILIRCCFSIFTKKGMHVNTDLEVIHRMPIIFPSLSIHFKRKFKVFNCTTYNRKHDWKSQLSCTDYRRSCASNSYPNRQRTMNRARKYFLIDQG